MSSKKRRGAQPPTREQAKRDLGRLKKLGLYKGDLRKNPTRYGLKQIHLFRDVLKHDARVISAPTQKKAREYKETFKTKFRKIVVPVRKDDKVTYSKKTGEVIIYSKQYGRNLKRVYPPKPASLADIDNLPRGRNISYRLPIGTGGEMENVTFAQLKRFASKYSKSSAWKAYLQVQYDETEGAEDIDYEDIYGDGGDEE